MHTHSSLKLAARVAAVCMAGLYCTGPAAAQHHPWAEMARADADFVIGWIMRQSISAIYPDKDAFAVRLAAARRSFDVKSSRVASYEGYRQALGGFVGALQDGHLRLQLSLAPASYRWPGFMAIYRGGRYVAFSAQAHELAGQEITYCDGKPMADWVREVGAHEQFIAGLESTKARAAPLVLRDADSPFVARPGSCRIGGREVKLDWQPVAAGRFRADMLGATVMQDRTVAATPFGAGGAWVRMGFFQPQTAAEGRAFRLLIEQAPALRGASVIVLDVRGNGGGPYNWFMGFLRALYGAGFTDYHARARLQISNVFRATPEILAEFKTTTAAEVGELAPPADGEPVDLDNARFQRALDAGQPLFAIPANAQGIRMPKAAPRNPVRARVFVLTDYACSSACIAFVDELKRIPGVKQIGVETGIDARTGTSFGAPLPSGNGVIEVPVMTRDGRARGDNIPHRPEHVFTGDIVDTAALKAWVMDELAGHDPDRR